MLLSGFSYNDTIYTPFNFESQKISGWRELPRTEKGKLFTVPDDIVKRMNTEALLQTFLDYPFTIDFLAYNTYFQGYMALRKEFKPLVALVERPDLPKAIIKKYQSVDDSDKLSSDIDIITPIWLAALCTQKDVFSLFTSDEMDYFISIMTEGDYSSFFYHIQYESSDDLFRSKFKTAFPSLQRAVYVQTPEGTSVAVIDRTTLTDFTDAQRKVMNDQITSKYVVYVIEQPSKYYNCHSYAWYNASSNNNRWMNDPSAYMKDSSYSKVTGAVAVNDKHYMNPTHSAIINGISNSMAGIKSKWGEYGVYSGPVTQLPPDYTNTGYPDYYTGASQWRR
jgi:hypothetical protein